MTEYLLHIPYDIIVVIQTINAVFCVIKKNAISVVKRENLNMSQLNAKYAENIVINLFVFMSLKATNHFVAFV